MSTALPETGQLVEVRRRQWVVADLKASSLDQGANGSSQHLISLNSLDDDSLDETLTVVWELEPGARVLETAGLPSVDGWDTSEKIEAFLDAVRWGAVTSADHRLLQSPFRSGIQIQDHQLDPLVRAIDMARTNLLIADDVGLGKTIEAGLVVQELLIRHRARTALVICPASLQTKWQDEMWDKFGLEFRIVDTEYLKKLRRERGIHANPWTSFPRLITSMDWMKRGEGLRLIKDVLPPHVTYPRKFDILIVDEAHNIAPAMGGKRKYALPSQRTRLIRRISPLFEHKLLLTAPPQHGYQASFTALLELLDDQRFARGMMPDEQQLHQVMVRRMKTELVDKDGIRIYPEREICALLVSYTEEEREAHRLLQEYASSRGSQDSGGSRRVGMDFIHKLLKKRLFSSPRGFAQTLAKHKQTVAKGGSKKQNKAIDERILRKAILKCDEDYANDSALETAQDEAVEAVSKVSAPLTQEQRLLLDKLSVWAEGAKNKPDSKAEAILAWLDGHLKDDGEWNQKRVILFTEYKATHSWMKEILVSHGWGGDRLMLLTGETEHDEREIIKAAFQASPTISPVRILLATDAASEGIDLQNHCNYMIHIEIPWNPNVLEQRNGRIDRHGQREEKVYIWHPVGVLQNTEDDSSAKPGDLDGDHEFLFRAVKKVQKMREDLGCVGPVIADQVEEAMLGRRRTMNTRHAEEKAASTKRFLSVERKLQERISRLHEQLLEARDNQELHPHRIARAIKVAMQMAKKPSLEPVALPNTESVEAYRLPILTGSWKKATEGLAHPHTGEIRPVTFDHEVADGRDDVVLAHLQHKLVQMCLRLLRAEIWAHDDRKALHRVAIKRLPKGMSEHPVVVVWSRLVITGSAHHRLHEELTMSGGELKPNSFARVTTLGRFEELLEASAELADPTLVFPGLQKRFRAQETRIMQAVEARSKDRLRFLVNTLERRQEAEEKYINGVLDDLDALIRKNLEGPEQLSFAGEGWSPEEEDAGKRDEEALWARLERIPDEREKELSIIRRRYDSPEERTFPVAVEFLVPEELLEEGALS